MPLFNGSVLIIFGITLGVAISFALGPALFSIDSREVASVISGYATLLLVPITAAYALLTWIIVQETRKTREEAIRPNVIVTIEPGSYVRYYDIVIENVGRGPAYDLNIDFQPDIEVNDDDRERFNISSLSFCRMPVLKNGQLLRSYLAKYNAFNPAKAKVVVSCRDANGFNHCFESEIDLSMYSSSRRREKDSLESIAKNLDSISRNLNSCMSSGRMIVDVLSETDRLSEKDENYHELTEKI